MDARDAYLGHIFTGEEAHSPDDIRAAAQEELDQLRMKSAMPWIRILEDWKTKLSERLGRSEEDIRAANLLATDFSDDGVQIRFEDGTDLTFRRAFYLGETPADGAIHRIVVFAEHCGYHEFWIGPNDRVEVTRNPSKTRTIGPLKKKLKVIGRMQVDQGGDAEQGLATQNIGQISEEELAWDAMAPVGREFGSPDYEKLMTEDAAEFASDLARWIQLRIPLNIATHSNPNPTSLSSPK
ncbi:MAG: hypothetical protein CFE43_02010 [Burkholderiales bacterium PBB3]|nr:MAG: hypothetical protein CFE43_02010 [Burkholderiales bacterium PBB3]